MYNSSVVWLMFRLRSSSHCGLLTWIRSKHFVVFNGVCSRSDPGFDNLPGTSFSHIDCDRAAENLFK